MLERCCIRRDVVLLLHTYSTQANPSTVVRGLLLSLYKTNGVVQPSQYNRDNRREELQLRYVLNDILVLRLPHTHD